MPGSAFWPDALTKGRVERAWQEGWTGLAGGLSGLGRRVDRARQASPPEQLQRERAPRVSGTERDGLLQCAASARFPHSAFLLSGQLEREASACRASPSPGPPTSSEVCPVPHSCARVVRGPPTGTGVVGLSWEQPRLAWWSIPVNPVQSRSPGQTRPIPINPGQSRSVPVPRSIPVNPCQSRSIPFSPGLPLMDVGVVNRVACVVLGNNGGLRGLSWLSF